MTEVTTPTPENPVAEEPVVVTEEMRVATRDMLQALTEEKKALMIAADEKQAMIDAINERVVYDKETLDFTYAQLFALDDTDVRLDAYRLFVDKLGEFLFQE